MLKIYGSMLCPDCVECLKDLDRVGVHYEYFDICDHLPHMKEFLNLRDENVIFNSVKRNGSIGIPCLIDDNCCVTLDWSQYVSQDNA